MTANRALRITAALALALGPTVAACSKPSDSAQARGTPTPIRAQIRVAPVVDHHPWVIAFVTEISIARPPGADARLEGRTGPEGLRHPEPIIEAETREALADALADYERRRPRMPELRPVWQPEPFGPHERVAWRLYFVDTSRGFTLDDDARATLEPHDLGPRVHVQLGESQRQQLAALTTEQVGRRIAITADDEVLMLPVVVEPIPDGDIALVTSPHLDPKLSAPALFERLTAK
ncbi:SecDF P1 head subdomain-containing protein [Enhygromyxa salina]|uniref:Preprotein translocase subunit SecD n=1 Tax=Enhygromyxa salina TaxID=215803 RepID=A0A2S9YSG6_9BACT|nr:hypothetical protein [Enhygromyxa salina]PRQ08033.1 preprotein translocase subunit SecD [Enhygromyxa salina]